MVFPLRRRRRRRAGSPDALSVCPGPTRNSLFVGTSWTAVLGHRRADGRKRAVSSGSTGKECGGTEASDRPPRRGASRGVTCVSPQTECARTKAVGIGRKSRSTVRRQLASDVAVRASSTCSLRGSSSLAPSTPSELPPHHPRWHW